MPVTPSPQVISELAPTGALRAAINMGNFLLVTGRTPSGDPTGVSPDMAAAIAARLGVPVKFVPYERPGQIADDAENGKWDIGNIGAEPQRAAVINFTAAYCEIEATYLVPAGSPIRSVAEVDQPGRRCRGDRAQRLRAVARKQLHQGRTAAIRHCRRGDPGLYRAEDGRLCRAASGADRRRRETAGLAHPRRPVHRGAAGGRHAEEERRRASRSCAISSRSRKRTG